MGALRGKESIMSDTSDSTGSAKADDSDTFNDFDETNGLAPGLDGDDGGALNPDGDDTILGNLTNAFRDHRHEDTSETPYSEEGQN
jgi:hypothetical protein